MGEAGRGVIKLRAEKGLLNCNLIQFLAMNAMSVKVINENLPHGGFLGGIWIAPAVPAIDSATYSAKGANS
jgi:hypothetical protein